jgi:hypothetical protein
MSFATAWLDERALFPELFAEVPDNLTGIIVVIPAYNEPDIQFLLDSLASCTEPDCKVEIIIVINTPAEASEESILNNRKSINCIETWKRKNKNCFFRLLVFDAGQPSISHWGVGLARKTGMDEALRRFNAIGKPEGVIVSLDADCVVEKNYFTSICNDLLMVKERTACSIYFEHPLSGNNFPERIYKYIIQYELHLRYYIQGLKYSGFPYAFHTVGSAIAVKAFQYAKVGGMSRKQAGEDFYFIQKLVPTGRYFNLNTTTVYPSPRESYRVPFGTGVIINRLMDNKEPTLLTYNMSAFSELRQLFLAADKLFLSSTTEIRDFYKTLPAGLRSFIDEKEWLSRITELKSNTSGKDSFLKRFFGWFNMFRIVKYLNYVHPAKFEKQPVVKAASDLFSITGQPFVSNDPHYLLILLRSLEKGINYSSF